MTSGAPPPAAAGFESGVLGLRDKLRGFIRRRVRDAATADDLAQDTLLRVFRSRARLRDDTRLEAWIFQTARNAIADHYRRARPEEELPADLANAPDEGNPFLRVLATAVRGMIDELPPLYRAPLLLSEIEGRPQADVARQLGLTLTAAKSRVRRGRQLLQRRIQECCRLEFNRAGQLTACEPRATGCCT